jgi:hypothetical protein
MTTFTSVATAAFVLLVSSIPALWHPSQLTGAMVVGIGLILIVAVAIANDLHRIEKKLSEPTDEKILRRENRTQRSNKDLNPRSSPPI